ncbi:MAG: hypothetical protein Q8S84_08235 [bacterium]|nr:hypothetical protein [bacterium]
MLKIFIHESLMKFISPSSLDILLQYVAFESSCFTHLILQSITQLRVLISNPGHIISNLLNMS